MGSPKGRRRWGRQGALLCGGHMHTQKHTFSLTCTRMYTQATPPRIRTCRDIGVKYVWSMHILVCMHTHNHFMHVPANNCTHSWAHTGICIKFMCYPYIHLRKSTLTRQQALTQTQICVRMHMNKSTDQLRLIQTCVCTRVVHTHTHSNCLIQNPKARQL